ncbi:MAG: hypothetical protein ACLTKQ_07150 [Acutalibacteraceae bacterium]
MDQYGQSVGGPTPSVWAVVCRLGFEREFMPTLMHWPIGDTNYDFTCYNIYGGVGYGPAADGRRWLIVSYWDSYGDADHRFAIR